MKIDRYELKAGAEFLTFEFVSAGLKGNFIRTIQFELIGSHGLYNFTLGDKKTGSDDIDDLVVSDNIDSWNIDTNAMFGSLLPFSRVHLSLNRKNYGFIQVKIKIMETVLRTNYKPGRTVEEVEMERLHERLNHTPTESFKIMMKLIRVGEKMKKAKVTYSPNTIT